MKQEMKWWSKEKGKEEKERWREQGGEETRWLEKMRGEKDNKEEERVKRSTDFTTLLYSSKYWFLLPGTITKNITA